MQERLHLQKDLFHRILKLHALRSREENHELLHLVAEDALVFELVYNQIMERFETDEDVLTTRGEAGEVLVENSGQLLYWLASHRSELLVEIHSVIDAFGGIEIASFLIHESEDIAY